MLVRWFLACAALGSLLFAQKKPITIETLTEAANSSTGFHGEVVWSPDGKRFAYLQNGRIMLYDIRQKSAKELLSTDVLETAAVAPPESDRFGWENRHVSEESLEWFPSGNQLLVTARGDLFAVGV